MANNEQINSLINKLSQHLNADSEQIKSALQKGNLNKVLEHMDDSKAAQINSILSDPVQAQKVLSSAQAQALIKKLMG